MIQKTKLKLNLKKYKKSHKSRKGGSIFSSFFGKKTKREITLGDLITYYKNIDNIPLKAFTQPPKDILFKKESLNNIFEKEEEYAADKNYRYI